MTTKKAVDSVKSQGEESDYIKLERGDPRKFPHLSTGSFILDRIIGCYGVPLGRMSEFFGVESSGKSTIGVMLCVQAQKAGFPALYVDFERAFHKGYAIRLGLDLDPQKFALYRPPYFERGAKVIMEALRGNLDLPNKKKFGIPKVIIVDSVSAMTPRKEFEADEETKKQEIGLLPRLMAPFLSKLSKLLGGTKSSIVFLNQERDVIKLNPFDYRPDYTTTGGNALRYYTSVRVRLEPRRAVKGVKLNRVTGKKENMIIVRYIKATAVKNKICDEGEHAELILRLGRGIENVTSVIEVAVNYGIIEQKGGWFTYNKSKNTKGNFKVQGAENVKKKIQENLFVYDELVNQILELDEKIAQGANVESKN